MRILIFGGTRFLSRAVAVEAQRRGHQVTCACRGESGPLPEGVRHLHLDREQPLPSPSAAFDPDSFEAVVDVARHPSRVRAAVAAVPTAQWVFVSTINVYDESAQVGAGPHDSALLDPIHDDVDLAVRPEAYGPMKVSCEQAIRDGARSWLIIRPGLIVGPHDPTGRFTYWPERMARGGEILAPGSPEDLVQVIDVEDHARWIVDACEQQRTGVVDGVGPVYRMADFLHEIARGVRTITARDDLTLTWVDHNFLATQGIQPWSGPESVPMWLPRPEHNWMMTRNADLPQQAGLTNRPLADIARDTFAWSHNNDHAVRTGITAEREQAVLTAWNRMS